MIQRTCQRCQNEFKPVRKAQRYCCRKCRVVDAVGRHRSDYTKPHPPAVAEKRLQCLSDFPRPLSDGSTVVWPNRDEQRGPTPGALRGDDYPLEYHEDDPKLPTCLDRRRIVFAEAA